jgi:hypothetical protein
MSSCSCSNKHLVNQIIDRLLLTNQTELTKPSKLFQWHVIDVDTLKWECQDKLQ